MSALILFSILWLLWALACAALRRIGTRGEEITGLVVLALRFHAHFMQRVRYEGLEHIPRSAAPAPGDIHSAPEAHGVGPLLVVVNHTAGVDPLLIQALVPFEVRWMMAREMMMVWDEFWAFTRMIPVSRDGKDSAAVRDAIDYLRQGGVVGVFPEGRIAQPRGTILPFQPGVGLLVSRTGARVLQAIVTGTPECERAWGSLWTRGHAVVRFLPIRDYTNMKPAAIVADMQARLGEETGWKVRTQPSPEV